MLVSETAAAPHFGVLRAHLWKESRENRTAFLLILGVVLLACPAMVLTYRHFDWATGSAPGIAAGLTLVLAMVGLGDSVLSRELASSRRPALSRLPGAIRAAYVVRVPLYLGALSALVVIAYGWTLVFASACSFPMEARPIADYAPLLVVAAIFIAWSLTASCWIRQGVLAVPMALTLLGLFVLPWFAAASASGGHWSREIREAITGDRLLDCALALAVAGLISAWMSFSRGMRRGGSRAAAARAGSLSFLAFGLLPMYGYAAHRLAEWRALDLEDPGILLEGAGLSVDGQTLYLSAASAWERPAHAISLDLVRGDWRDHGPHTVFFRVPPFCDRSGRLTSVGFGEHLTTRVGVGRRTLRDASTGEELSLLPVQTAGGRIDAPQSVHLAESDRYVAEVTEDLALILVTDPKPAGARPQQDSEVELLDLRTGAREPLHFDNGDPARARMAWSCASGERHQTPGGALVLALFSESLPMMIVRLDLDARCLTRLRTPAYQIVGCEDENTVLIISADGHQVLRAHFDESPVEVLFPAAN